MLVAGRTSASVRSESEKFMAGNVTVHVVAKGETLETIARKYKIRPWKTIYDDPANARFRKLRKNPDQIMPGDKIVIQMPGPSRQSIKSLDTLIAMLQARIKKLEGIQSAGQKTTRQLVAGIRKQAGNAKNVAEAADLAATILLFMKDLSKLAIGGWKAVQKSGAELDAANKVFGKEFAKFQVSSKKGLLADPAYEKARQAEKLRSTSPILEGSMIIYDSWLKLGKPSFWAKTWVKLDETGFLRKLAGGKFSDAWGAWSKAVTWDPQEEFRKGINQIEDQQKQLDKRLKKSINADRKLLEQLLRIRKNG
jgi:LysM domain